MKTKLIMGMLLLSASSLSFSQTAEDMGKVVLGVRFPDDVSQETMDLKPQLEDKLVKFATQSGYSSFGSNAFFISPNVVVNSTDVAEGGMKNVYVVQGELYLTIQDGVNGIVYSSDSFPFKGSATKRETAVKNGVLNINYGKVQTLFTEAKSRILSFYTQQQEVIFARAETCAKNGNYDEAIACLMMVPEELSDLHLKAIGKAQQIYNMRTQAIRQQQIAARRSSNEAILTEANSLLAMHQPQEALKTLWKYRNGSTEQNAQYDELVQKAEGQVSAAEAEALRKEERAYRDNKQREDRLWSEYTKDAEHQRDMDRRNADLKEQIVESAERVARDKIKSDERTAYYNAAVESQKVEALKTVACEYIRRNPHADYIHVKF